MIPLHRWHLIIVVSYQKYVEIFVSNYIELDVSKVPAPGQAAIASGKVFRCSAVRMACLPGRSAGGLLS
jgi:hypothetical protein